MDYDVRIDEGGDVWIVIEYQGRRVEMNKTKLDAYGWDIEDAPVFERPTRYYFNTWA